MWAIQERSITTSRRNIRTKSGSSWNMYKENARHGTNCRKVTCKRSKNCQEANWLKTLRQYLHYSRARVSRQSTTMATTTRSTQMLRLTTSTPGIHWLHHCTFRSEEQVRAFCRFITHKEKACFNVHSQFLASTERPVYLDVTRSANLTKSWDNCQIRITFGKTRDQLLAEAKPEILRHENRADLADNNTCELKRRIDSQSVEIGHTRTGYEQSRREQALLHEEMADRERARRDSRTRNIQKVGRNKQRAGISTRRNFDREELVENHFIDVESVRSDNYFAFQSTSVISSSSWTRRIAEPRLKFAAKYMGYAWYVGKRFCMVHKRLLRQLMQEWSIPWIDFSSYVKICWCKQVQERTRNRKWWSRPQPIFMPTWLKSQTVSQFSILIFEFLKRPSTGILTFFQQGVFLKYLKSQDVSGFSETLKGN